MHDIFPCRICLLAERDEWKSGIGRDMIVSSLCPAIGLGDGDMLCTQMVKEGSKAPGGFLSFEMHWESPRLGVAATIATGQQNTSRKPPVPSNRGSPRGPAIPE